MRRLTLNLPDSLHHQLQSLAAYEGAPLDQFIVDALTRHVSLMPSIQAVPEEAVAEQRAAYTALLQNLGEASFEQIQEALAERANVPLEGGLSPDVVKRIKQRVKDNT